MNRLIVITLGISCSLLAVGCAAEEDGTISSAQQDVISSGPVITKAGTSSASVLEPSGLRIDGGSEVGAFLIASYGATTGSSDATARVTVTPSPGAAFVYILLGSGTGYSGRQLRLQRMPGSSDLQAVASTGSVTCGTLASDTPTTLTVVYHAALHTFDVVMAGAGCTNLPTKLQAPITGFDLMDASNDGWGGRVDFTDLAVF